MNEPVLWREILDEDRYELSGPERISFLNSYVTQDMQNLPVLSLTPAAFLTQKGKLVSTVQVLHWENSLLLLFPQGYGAKVEAHLKTYLLFASVTLQEVSAHWAHFVLFGEKASQILAEWIGETSKPEAGKIERHGEAADAVYLFASERFGIPAWEILTPTAAAPKWREKFLVAERSGDLAAADEKFLETKRIEAGLPKLGIDMGEDNLVAEVGLDQSATTSFNKGCYLGQETTARVQSRGHVNRKLLQVKLESPYRGALPADLLQGEKKVGVLTSALESSKFGGAIGLATLQLSAWETAAPIFLAAGDGKIIVERL